MNLKIGGSVPMSGVSRYNNVQKAVSKQAVTIEGADKLDISQSSRSFETALRAVKDAPEIRTDKVRELQESINNGTYRVDARVLADKMLSEVK